MSSEFQPWQVQLHKSVDQLRAIAQSQQGDTLALLEILRLLEALHREIRDEYFQSSLPNNRQALYNLLRTIESDGGWPYIARMKLRSFFENLPSEESMFNSGYFHNAPDTQVPPNAQSSS